jgi:nucleotide-binding universal stress UspA family protein
VIAVDERDEARRAARRGLQLAQTFDATVGVVSVVEQKALRLTETSDEKTRLRERGEETLTEIEELASDFGHPVATKLAEGKPAVQINEYADEQDADLLVVGRQGLTGLSRRLLGGVTEQVLHRSNVPVLVVPGESQERESEGNYSRVLITTDGSENAEVSIHHRTAIAQRYDSTVHVAPSLLSVSTRISPYGYVRRHRNSVAKESRPSGPAKTRPRTHGAPAHLHGPARAHRALCGLSQVEE